MKTHYKALVVLDTMWGSRRAPAHFRINPYNHSGRRLIRLLGHRDFVVTNACPQAVRRANDHGRPDPAWLAANLQSISYDLLLVCGGVAQRTYARCGYCPPCPVLLAMHPASRTWTKAALEELTARLCQYR